jgi:hypothetical protein
MTNNESSNSKLLNKNTNDKNEIIDERSKLGNFLYDLQNFNIECRTAILMNNRVNYFRGK